MDEFALIKNCFAPLARGFSGSLGLCDDAAVFSFPAGEELVITKDAITAGIHFIGDEDPSLIAQKLLRVNLSDLAAMGAKPLCYFLAVFLPKEIKAEWVQSFAKGLQKDQDFFSIYLAGGDTTAINGPLSFSLTALGTVPSGQALKRSGAKAGDNIYVSGTLGDSALGLIGLRSGNADPYLKQRYLLPEPRVALGEKLRGIAHACIDISDGLLQDLGHICETSGVGATIQRNLLPLSAPASALIKQNASYWDAVLGGGDDYELLFTVPTDKEFAIAALALPLIKIGTVNAGSGVKLLDGHGATLPITHQGYRHF